MMAKFKKQYEEVEKKRDSTDDQRAYLYYDTQMAKFEASRKLYETKGKGAKSLLSKLAEDDKAYEGVKKIADKAKEVAAELAWKEKAAQTKKDETSFKGKMDAVIKRVGELKAVLKDEKATKEKKAAATKELITKNKEANSFKV